MNNGPISQKESLCWCVSNCRSFYQALKAVYNPFIPCNSDFKLPHWQRFYPELLAINILTFSLVPIAWSIWLQLTVSKDNLQLDEILTAQRIAKSIGQFKYGKASSINSVVVNVSGRKVDLLHKLLGFYFLFKTDSYQILL